MISWLIITCAAVLFLIALALMLEWANKHSTDEGEELGHSDYHCAHADYLQAQANFDQAEPEFIDSAIYDMCGAEIRLDNEIRTLKQGGEGHVKSSSTTAAHSMELDRS